METTVVDGNGTETGHIIVTTIGGKNGQPKQVCHRLSFSITCFAIEYICCNGIFYCEDLDYKLYG